MSWLIRVDFILFSSSIIDQPIFAYFSTFSVGAKVMGTLTKDEFVKGFVEMGVSDVVSLKARLPALRGHLNNADFFRESRPFVCTCSHVKLLYCIPRCRKVLVMGV